MLLSVYLLVWTLVLSGQGTSLNLPLGGFSGGSVGEESACQCRRHGFDSWVGKTFWRRAWQSIPAFLPRESHGQGSLAGYSPLGHRESGTIEATEHACMHTYPLGDLPSFIHCLLHPHPSLHVIIQVSSLGLVSKGETNKTQSRPQGSWSSTCSVNVCM